MSDGLAFDVERWTSFLRDWDAEIVSIARASREDMRDAPLRGVVERGSILRAPASETQLAAADATLGPPGLPESLRRFYRASNGLTIIGFDAVNGDLWPAQQIRRFKTGHPELVRAWELEEFDADDREYFDYSPKQSSTAIRSRYLSGLWQLSEFVDSSVLLLNPAVVDSRREWEAWMLGVNLPGALRFRSFEEMMVRVRERSTRNAKATYLRR